MNLKTMFTIGLVGFGLAFAQEASEAVQETSPSMSEQELQKEEERAANTQNLTGSVKFVAPEIPKDAKSSSFNGVLHGKSYNRNRNMAAANNTDLLLTYPNLFANRKFFYIEPTNRLGILSLGSFFTAFDISNATDDDSQLGRLTLGYAVPGFGFYVRGSLGQFKDSDEDVEQKTTSGGDDWAFALAKSFSGMNLALSCDWFTKRNQTTTELDDGDETEEKFNDLTVELSLTNAPTAKNFTWTTGLKFLNSFDEILVNDEVDESEDVNSFFEITPYIRGGLSVLENDNARILIGGGAVFSYKNYYDPREDYEIALILQPSMLGEVFVGEKKNFMFYGEVGYDWVAFQYIKDTDTDASSLSDFMNSVSTSVGFRYQYKDFLAVELGLSQQLFTNAGAFFNGNNTFVDFSAMIRF